MIIFDLDGTLADCEHRRHFVEDRREIAQLNEIHLIGDRFKPDWQAFYEACDKDVPINSTIAILNQCLYAEYKIDVWSGRSECVREKTERWLVKHTLFSSKYPFEIRMRPIGNTEPDEMLKEMWLDEAIAKGKKIDFVFDDRPKVIRMWRRRGIFVFNCCQHDEEF